jgi:transcriptional regulator with XRE-family HTH domain
MKGAQAKTFDPKPLMDIARLKLGEDGWNDNKRDVVESVDCHRRIAELCGVSTGAVNRWAAGSRRMSSESADKAAIHLGLHPCLIWDDWWDA